MSRWNIATVPISQDRSVDDPKRIAEEAQLKVFLEDGWEPYAVTASTTHLQYHLRRHAERHRTVKKQPRLP